MSDHLPTGRVVRMHFTCRAELPIGSTLRVTGPTLWSPSASGVQATTASTATASAATPSSSTAGGGGAAGANAASNPVVTNSQLSAVAASTAASHTIDESILSANCLSSTTSVEMITTPDTYPIWKTKHPIVIVLHKTKAQQIQHYYYRYFVMTPGATMEEYIMTPVNEQQPSADTAMVDTTGSPYSMPTPVLMWENPFEQQLPKDDPDAGKLHSALSTQSLQTGPSLYPAPGFTPGAAASGTTSSTPFKELANLPYRTLDIHVGTGNIMNNSGTATAATDDDDAAAVVAKEGTGATSTTSTGTIAMVPTDTWNNVHDDTFRAYQIRETMERQQQLQADAAGITAKSASAKSLTKQISDVSDDFDMDTSGESKTSSGGAVGGKHHAAAPPQQIFFICFHLPVVVVKINNIWKASWSESLLAQKEGSMIANTYRAHWVGTVTTHPPISNQNDMDEVRALLLNMDCTPIFLPDHIRQAHYYGFCKQVLWPAFHNIDLLDLSTMKRATSDIGSSGDATTPATASGADSAAGGGPGGGSGGAPSSSSGGGSNGGFASDWDQSRLDDWWNAYKVVNQEFATVVQNLVQDPDNTYLWIHDYHLSLLPRYLQMSNPGEEENEDNGTTSNKGSSSQLQQLQPQQQGQQVSTTPPSGTPTRSNGGGLSCRTVFFLHIPFPTSQIFRELECGQSILEGMLHADVVGFHAFDHARHFLNAAKRILGLNYESLVGGLIGVNFLGKTVLVSMSNVSIEPRMVDAALALPSVENGRQALRKKHGDRIIIAGVDIGQRLSGTSLKLLAYERLLHDYPNWQTKVVMVQKVLVPGSRKADEAVTVKELRVLVKRIQDKFGPAVIDYQEIVGSSSVAMDQRLALWKASDVLMCTPIREGLNELPMEYIYAKDKEKPGVIIASEFSAVCSILNGALRVNPFDIQMAITIIDKALSMEMVEREGRHYRDIDFVSNSPSDKWVKNVLRDLKDATRKQNRPSGSGQDSNSATPTPRWTSTAAAEEAAREVLQGTAAFLLREASAAFAHLNLRSLKQAYDTTTRRVIVLDFNGTIVLKEPPGKYLKREILGTSGNKPPPEVLESLALLCADLRNTVYVVSGDSSENVLNALGHIPNLGLAFSNGAKFSRPTAAGVPRTWQTFDLGVDWDAVKRVALPVLSKYTARSNGSFVKLTTFSIGWSYYSCDPEWGSLQASHLVLELESELKAFDVRFVTLKGIVEIVPRKLNKGLIVNKTLKDISSTSPDGVDFILCFGDDISDEKMFTSVSSFLSEVGDDTNATPSPAVVNEDGTRESTSPTDQAICRIRDPTYCYTVAVGKKPSHASMYVSDAQEVASALVLLAKGEYPRGGSQSWGAQGGSHLFT